MFKTTQSESESLDDESPESLFSLLSPESLESLESFESLPLSDEESSSELDPYNTEFILHGIQSLFLFVLFTQCMEGRHNGGASQCFIFGTIQSMSASSESNIPVKQNKVIQFLKMSHCKQARHICRICPLTFEPG
jgi:hypothetical protein